MPTVWYNIDIKVKERAMIQDLHSHTYYSFCGNDVPEALIEVAIAGGVEMLGICDHNYGIAFARKEFYKSELDISNTNYERTLIRYFDHMNLLKEKYADKIEIKRGIEVATTLKFPRMLLPENTSLAIFDYALIEHIGNPDMSCVGRDLFSFVRALGCPCGIAHTDIFGYIDTLSEEPLDYLKRMADAGIFWEINVNYDSIHKYSEHAYVKRFFESEREQELVRESGVKLSVGFDSHKADEYNADRIRSACERIEMLGIPLAFA